MWLRRYGHLKIGKHGNFDNQSFEKIRVKVYELQGYNFFSNHSFLSMILIPKEVFSVSTKSSTDLEFQLDGGIFLTEF